MLKKSLIEGPGGEPDTVIRDRRWGLKPKKNSALATSRELEGPSGGGGAGHRQGPSGIDAEGKRKRLCPFRARKTRRK